MNKTTDYYIQDVPLKDIQKILFDLLNEVDRICTKNNIKYFLSGGTLLGAIRHNGFIPWDDDLDIWMTRKNFKLFKNALKKELNKEKFCYEDYYSNINFPLSILKIKRKDTIFVEKEFEHLNILHNIYIDIFPLDKVVKPFFRLQTHFIARFQSMRLYKLDSDKKKYKKIKRFVYFFFPIRLVRFLSETTIRFFNCTCSKKYGQLAHRGRFWPIFTNKQVNDLICWRFESGTYPVPKDYDLILKKCYGNYLELPDTSNQKPSHNIVSCKIAIKESEK